MEGGCTCRHIRYRLIGKPMIVHACHCRWCQRETGTAHAMNAVYEADRVLHIAQEPELIDTPSASGKGQRIARCPICRVAVWSNYAGFGPLARFVRVGTLDDPDFCPPDVHIYTDSKQAWVIIPAGVKSYPEYYERADVWSPESIERLRTLRASGRR
ncbi:MAG: GFA family protein [Hyphomicrobiaceae bacterium]